MDSTLIMLLGECNFSGSSPLHFCCTEPRTPMFTTSSLPLFNSLGIFLGLVAAMLGCQKDVEKPALAVRSSEAILSEVPEPPSEIAARVNGAPIYQQEVDRRLSQIQRIYRHSRTRFDASIEAQKRREVIDRLIDKELLHQHVLEREVNVSDEAVDAELQHRIATIFGSNHALNRYLRDQDLDLQRYRTRIRSELAVKTLCMASVANNPTNEEDLRKLYEQLAHHRAAAERVEVSSILFRMPAGVSEKTQQNLRRTAERSVNRAQTPEQFAVLAKSLSYGPTAQEGGYHGWIEKGTLPESTEKLLFETRPGQLTPAIITPAGIEIFWIHQKRPAGVRHFDEVEDVLREHHAQDAIEQQRRHLLKTLRESADIQYMSPAP